MHCKRDDFDTVTIVFYCSLLTNDCHCVDCVYVNAFSFIVYILFFFSGCIAKPHCEHCCDIDCHHCACEPCCGGCCCHHCPCCHCCHHCCHCCHCRREIVANKPRRGKTFVLTVLNSRAKRRKNWSPSRTYKIGTNHKEYQKRRG